MTAIIQALITFLYIYNTILVIYALITWFPDAGRLRYYLEEVVRPVLGPIEQLLPYNLRMFSVMIAFLVIQIVIAILEGLY